MKNILVILICILSHTLYAQDSVMVSQIELDEIIEAIEILTEQDSINNVLIGVYDEQVSNYRLLAKHDSLILSFKEEEIKLLNEQIILYTEELDRSDKWYNRRPFGFAMGVINTLALFFAIDNI